MDVDGVAQQAGVDWAPDLIVSGEGLCKQQETRAQVNPAFHLRGGSRQTGATQTHNKCHVRKQTATSHPHLTTHICRKYPRRSTETCLQMSSQKKMGFHNSNINRHKRDQCNKISLRERNKYNCLIWSTFKY